MDWETWGPALASSGVVTVAGLAGGYLLKAAVEKGVQFTFDRQIEQLRADIKSKEDQIKSLRSGALANMAARHEELDKRRIRAAEALWQATVRRQRYTMAIQFVGILNFPKVDEAFENGGVAAEKMKEFGDTLWQGASLDTLTQEDNTVAEVERLFVPPKAWLAFSALQSIGNAAVARLVSIKTGIGSQILKDQSEVVKQVVAVLPHREEYLKQYPQNGHFYLTKELQEMVFLELSKSLTASESDRVAVTQAWEILKHAKQHFDVDLPEGLPASLKIDPPDLPTG